MCYQVTARAVRTKHETILRVLHKDEGGSRGTWKPNRVRGNRRLWRVCGHSLVRNPSAQVGGWPTHSKPTPNYIQKKGAPPFRALCGRWDAIPPEVTAFPKTQPTPRIHNSHSGTPTPTFLTIPLTSL